MIRYPYIQLHWYILKNKGVVIQTYHMLRAIMS